MFNSNQAFLLLQKLKLIPRALHYVKAEVEKIFSICPKLLINAELLLPCIRPKAEKRISNLGSQFATLGADVPAFITILMSMF
jgi:hypothetical protein